MAPKRERASEKGKGVRDVDVTLRVSARGESVNGPIAFSTKGAREEGWIDRCGSGGDCNR